MNDVSSLTDAEVIYEVQHLIQALDHQPWESVARAEQLPPEGEWRVWYLQGGRGSGKTRSGAEWLAAQAKKKVGEWAVVAPTYRDARDVCVEGPSGLIKALGDDLQLWNRSMGELFLKNGSIIRCDAADDGGVRIQGHNLSGAWCDEVGLWQRWERAWSESVSFAVRVPPARIVCTGTPKRGHGLVKLLVDNENVRVTRLRMRDNIANLSSAAVEELERLYAGTALGRQELDGEIIEDVDGALWTEAMIVAMRTEHVPKLAQVVVGVDPAGSAKNGTVGIVAVGVSEERWPHPRTGTPIRHMYVLADRSMQGPPEKWAATAIDLLHDFGGNRIVAEKNFGGDMVESVLRQVDVSAPVKMVTSSKGKYLRAEPIATISAQGLMHLNGRFTELEQEMTTWVEGETSKSPDRLDAMVFAATDLLDHVRGRGGIAVPTGSARSGGTGTTAQSKARIPR